MSRSATIRFHEGEAASLRASAAEAPGAASSRELLEQAADHDASAEAARVGEYEDHQITGTDY